MRPVSIVRAIRIAAVTALVFVVLVAVTACGGSSSNSLRSVEAAFYRAGIPFQADWQAGKGNPYLVGRQGENLSGFVPASLRKHLRADATGGSPVTFAIWQAFIFDSRAAAQSFAAREKRAVAATGSGANKPVVMVAANTVYVGKNSARARRAMARLHH
jgi:hypothetical protein